MSLWIHAKGLNNTPSQQESPQMWNDEHKDIISSGENWGMQFLGFASQATQTLPQLSDWRRLSEIPANNTKHSSTCFYHKIILCFIHILILLFQ